MEVQIGCRSTIAKGRRYTAYIECWQTLNWQGLDLRPKSRCRSTPCQAYVDLQHFFVVSPTSFTKCLQGDRTFMQTKRMCVDIHRKKMPQYTPLKNGVYANLKNVFRSTLSKHVQIDTTEKRCLCKPELCVQIYTSNKMSRKRQLKKGVYANPKNVCRSTPEKMPR